MTIHRSPTEPLFTALGPASGLPESYGVDFIFSAHGGLYGVQRKEYGDFVASVLDGRLGKELGQMGPLKQAVLCIEGRPQWTTEGMWMGRTQWSKASHYGYLWAVRARGVWVEYTDTAPGTAELIVAWEKWCNKAEHSELVTRGGPPAPVWGTASNREFQEWLLQSMPGVGPKAAKRIVDHYGGSPVVWRKDVSVETLTGVQGIGKVKAERLLKVFGDS